MSAAFKLAKKKVSQQDLRRLMQEQKQSRNKTESVNKIDSPFAKYDNGQLSCQLCKSVVRSEAVWKVHINTKQHKENLALAKQLKEKLESQNKPPAIEERLAALKRMRSRTTELPGGKKLKGILKHDSSSRDDDMEIPKTSEDSVSNGSAAIPDDFFDATSKPITLEKTSPSKQNEDKMQVDESLPEGFFDDAKKDAKARHIEYKDPIEEEWDKFQKEIKEAEVQSMTIITEEQEEATAERQIDEIDAQIKNWSRVLELEKKKEKIESKLKGEKQQEDPSITNSTSDSEDEEIVVELSFDWRAKKSHK